MIAVTAEADLKIPKSVCDGKCLTQNSASTVISTQPQKFYPRHGYHTDIDWYVEVLLAVQIFFLQFIDDFSFCSEPLLDCHQYHSAHLSSSLTYSTK